MKLVPIDKRDIPEKRRKKERKALRVLEEFMASGYECVRIDEFGWQAVSVAVSEINKEIARFGFTGVKAFSRGGVLYLLREQ